MSAARAFFDTNVLLYLLSDDAKADRAENLLAAGGVISVQVLNEFAAVASRKFKAPWPAIRESLQILSAALEVEAMTLDTHQRGVAIAERYQLNLYDGLILAAAQLAGCEVVYSEDMQAGLRIEGGPTILDPFRA